MTKNLLTKSAYCAAQAQLSRSLKAHLIELDDSWITPKEWDHFLVYRTVLEVNQKFNVPKHSLKIHVKEPAESSPILYCHGQRTSSVEDIRG
jgi:hypothetical protein